MRSLSYSYRWFVRLFVDWRCSCGPAVARVCSLKRFSVNHNAGEFECMVRFRNKSLSVTQGPLTAAGNKWKLSSHPQISQLQVSWNACARPQLAMALQQYSVFWVVSGPGLSTVQGVKTKQRIKFERRCVENTVACSGCTTGDGGILTKLLRLCSETQKRSKKSVEHQVIRRKHTWWK